MQIMAVEMRASYFSKSNNENNVKVIKPSIFIGIGGTGKSVMEAFRKRIVNKFGSLDNLPIIKFLYHDQDFNCKTNVNHDAANGDIMIKQDELVIDERTNFMTYKPPALKNHPHIEEWLNEDVYNFPVPKEGCDYRAFGRLTFFDKYSTNKKIIYDKLSAAIEGAKSLSSRQKAEVTLNMINTGANIKPEELNVYIVFSVAGGQGSGAFLDYAYFIKEKFKNLNPITMSYIFLPSFFSGTDTEDQRKVNGYAAVKELEHYNCGWNNFNVQWTSTETKVELGYAPFDYNHIFCKTNNNRVPVEYASIVEMVAESIYQDFDTNPFADKKRSLRANHGSALGAKFIAIEQGTNSIGMENNKKFLYSTFYTSSSLIKIYMPIDNMKEYLIYKYIDEVWKKLNSGDTDTNSINAGILDNRVSEEVKYLFQKMNFIDKPFALWKKDIQMEDAKKFAANIFLKDSSILVDDAHKTFSRLINEELTNLDKHSDEKNYKGILQIIDNALNYSFNETDSQYIKQFKFDKSKVKTDINEFIKSKVTGRGSIGFQTLSSIFQQAMQVVNEYDSDKINKALSLLKKYKDQVKNELNECRNHVNEISNPGFISIILGKAENIFSLLQSSLRASIQKLYELKITERLINEFKEQSIFTNFYNEPLEQFCNFINTKMIKTSHIISDLISNKIQKCEANFKENKGNEKIIINLYDEELLKKYKAQVDYSKIQINFDGSIFKIDADDIRRMADDILVNIYSQIKPYFINLGKDFDIIDYIVSNSNSGKIVSIQTIAYLAAPMYLANETEFDQKNMRINKRKSTIALCKRDDSKESHSEFFKQLKDYGLSLDGSNLVRNSNDSTYIIIFTEHAGFPLAYLNEIEEIKKEYLVDSQKTRSFSHTQKDYDKFRDILIWNQDGYRNQVENYYLLTKAILFGIINIEASVINEGKYKYKYYFKYNNEKLGQNEKSKELGENEDYVLKTLSRDEYITYKGDNIRTIKYLQNAILEAETPYNNYDNLKKLFAVISKYKDYVEAKFGTDTLESDAVKKLFNEISDKEQKYADNAHYSKQSVINDNENAKKKIELLCDCKINNENVEFKIENDYKPVLKKDFLTIVISCDGKSPISIAASADSTKRFQITLPLEAENLTKSMATLRNMGNVNLDKYFEENGKYILVATTAIDKIELQKKLIDLNVESIKEIKTLNSVYKVESTTAMEKSELENKLNSKGLKLKSYNKNNDVIIFEIECQIPLKEVKKILIDLGIDFDSIKGIE